MLTEMQLQTWSHQGAITTSKDTYHTVRNVLAATSTPYYGRDINIFLQGSYGNDTNVDAESDVDIVILLNDTFCYDMDKVTSIYERELIQGSIRPASYYFDEFKSDVLSVLKNSFGNDVHEGKKAISIEANGKRRKTDVVVACQYRDYYSFHGTLGAQYYKGIIFFTKDGQRIINYPKIHSKNLTSKHQATNGYLKPTIRVFKNIRNSLIDKKYIDKKLAPSYYIEGLLYNVPDIYFSLQLRATVWDILSWYFNFYTNKSEFICANERHPLFNESSPVCWDINSCNHFMNYVKILL